jgi:hypothetical protein
MARMLELACETIAVKGPCPELALALRREEWPDRRTLTMPRLASSPSCLTRLSSSSAVCSTTGGGALACSVRSLREGGGRGERTGAPRAARGGAGPSGPRGSPERTEELVDERDLISTDVELYLDPHGCDAASAVVQSCDAPIPRQPPARSSARRAAPSVLARCHRGARRKCRCLISEALIEIGAK